MKDVRPQFTDEEYARLREEADRLGIAVKQLVHDRALGAMPEDAPINSAKILSEDIAKCRAVLNQIIRNEVRVDRRLWEDDVIRMEMAMENLEAIVAAYVSRVVREVKRNGDVEI